MPYHSQDPRNEYNYTYPLSQTPTRSCLAMLLCPAGLRRTFPDPHNGPMLAAAIEPGYHDFAHRDRHPQRLRSKYAPSRTRTTSSGSESARPMVMLPVTQDSLSEIDEYSTSGAAGYSIWSDSRGDGPFYRHSYGGYMVRDQFEEPLSSQNRFRYSWDVDTTRETENLQAYQILNRASELHSLPVGPQNSNDYDHYDINDDVLSKRSDDTYDKLLKRSQRLDDYTPHALEPIQEGLPVFRSGELDRYYNSKHVLRRQQGSRTLRQDMRNMVTGPRPDIRSAFIHPSEPTQGRSNGKEPKSSSSTRGDSRHKYSTRDATSRNVSLSSRHGSSRPMTHPPPNLQVEQTRPSGRDSRPRRNRSHRVTNEGDGHQVSYASPGAGVRSRGGKKNNKSG